MKKAAMSIAIAVACTVAARAQTPPRHSAPGGSAASGAADGSVEQLANDPADWPMPGKNYAGTRFSKLDQINTQDVKNLSVAWTFSTGVLRGHEAAPIVVGDTMYVVTPWPDMVYALDLTKDGAIKWVFKPHPDPAAQGVACCDVVNRGVAYADGRIFFNTLDDRTIALDAKTGKQIWNTKLGDINHGDTITMAPLVVKNHVLVGVSGGELGVRCWLKSLDTGTGKVQWTAYSTGPDKDVLIGKDFNPPYPEDKGPNLGETSWPNKAAWEIGGGPVWGWITYDPKLNLIYYGTGNPGPWNPYQRPGLNFWTCTLFARDPDTGMAKWAVQWNPHDEHDYDGVNENVLANIDIDGQAREVLLHPDRNGFMYVQDRTTGKIISAQKFMPGANTIERINLVTGAPVVNPAKDPQLNKTVNDMCPAATGGKDWQPSAYSPVTGLLYIPHNNLCQDEEVSKVSYIEGTPFLGAKVAMKAGPGGYRGAFTAYDPVHAKIVWSDHENFPVWSGALVTAGGVAFYGTMDRWFKAVDAKTGKLLWKFRVGSGISGQPVTYKGPDGRQYVAVLAGVGGWSGAVVAGDLDPRNPYGALGFVGATQDLPDYTAKGGVLYVFALPKAGGSP
ncbi:MAG TPA: methanol/ethanol family PQQ-dependent dehydrogenase [Rhodanobacteraceae bacterium]|jgi:alcohol dehydrogenase (cytochrome c)|nr:methanol/ethanol family PQQ-dependent dehydrogenase [Rhodanobacteraceae bacterium]